MAPRQRGELEAAAGRLISAIQKEWSAEVGEEVAVESEAVMHTSHGLLIAAIPAYVGIARLKSQAHWQTDVLASVALGVAAGYFTSRLEQPLLLMLMGDGCFYRTEISMVGSGHG